MPNALTHWAANASGTSNTAKKRGRAYSFYRERLSGLAIATIYTQYESGVDDTAHQLAVRQRQNFGKKQDYGALFTETAIYDITFRGSRELEEERFLRYKNTTLNDIFYILRIRLNEPGLTMESRGADVVDNRAVEVVELVDADNRWSQFTSIKAPKCPSGRSFNATILKPG